MEKKKQALDLLYIRTTCIPYRSSSSPAIPPP